MRNFNFLNKEANMLQRLFNNEDIEWFGNNLFQVDRNRMNGVPPVNISENANGFMIEMAAPGYKKEDFVANVDKNLLTISVTKKGETENANTENNAENAEASKQEKKDEPVVYRKEFSFSSFSRSFTLPNGVDGQNISGSYENGILTLNIPKMAETETKRSIRII